MKVVCICKECGKEFEGDLRTKYCSAACCRNFQIKHYQHTHPEVMKKRSQAASFGVKNSILKKYGNKCAICGWELSDEKIITMANGKISNSRGNEIHHIVPVSEGGESTIENLILLCPLHHKQANAGLISRDELSKYAATVDRSDEREKNLKAGLANVLPTRSSRKRTQPSPVAEKKKPPKDFDDHGIRAFLKYRSEFNQGQELEELEKQLRDWGTRKEQSFDWEDNLHYSTRMFTITIGGGKGTTFRTYTWKKFAAAVFRVADGLEPDAEVVQ